MATIVQKIASNSFAIICILLSASLFIYIFGGFLNIFVHDLGPLSALLGSFASLITCAIAIRAIFLAKKWHSEKFKSEIFEFAQDTLNLITIAPLEMIIMRQNLREKVNLLNLIHNKKNLSNKQIILIKENFESCDDIQDKIQEMGLKLVKVLRYKKWINSKYSGYSYFVINILAELNPQLNRPYSLNDNTFVVNPEIERLIKKLTDSKLAMFRNEVAEIKVTDFMLINDALKEIDKQINTTSQK
ncbi:MULTISPECIES: hypothetical protein [Citrobacter]|uniref:hypothetical protein n=1 Tax=Citrobacter TaxID=544 RepID=UPI0010C98C96|nr:MULTISPECIES: hypothetical protein [Citrobacter]EKW1653208.1 hypothetical protein [Citrobacter freundii]TKU41563.1 hypothetical protein FDW94_18015 [Citrobacter sp. wls757]WNI85739.1 hypothetical protein RIK60_21115 [Citrobacter portucalensis]